MGIKQLMGASLLIAIPATALAGPGIPLPEPETLALLAIGAVALVIARWKKRK
jgi:PEP-CTERM motif